ncbi:hypothetical protein [Roseivirga seohaensis]|uniref:hypothetical protein n=1 Tax=Roseivirga seohaensis TaxID=1914963 RepID=UPI003BA99C8C
MNTLEIPSKNLLVNVPSTFDEMTAAQREYVLRQTVFYTNAHISKETWLINCFFALANIKRTAKTRFLEKLYGPAWVVEKNCNAIIYAETICADLLAVNNGQLEINYDSAHPPFTKAKPSLWAPAIHAPQSSLSDITFGEFRSAVAEMNDYFSSKDDYHLNRFVACLYRPKRKQLKKHMASDNFDGHTRALFNENKLDHWASIAAKLHPWQKIAVLLWFSSCIQTLKTGEITLPDRTLSLECLFPEPAKASKGDKPKKDPSDAGWQKVLTTIAKEGLFGNVASTDRQNLYTILVHMYDVHQNNLELERKFKPKTK